MQTNRHLEHVTLVLAAISSAMVEIPLAERQPGLGLPLLCVTIVLAIGLRYYVNRRSISDWNLRVVTSVFLIGLLPFAWDIVSRIFFGYGFPAEVQLVYLLRNAMLALLAVSALPRALAQAAAASFFLVLFSFLWSTGVLPYVLLVAYAICGTWWLLAIYWDRLGGRFADTSERSLPMRPASMAIGLLALMTLGLVPLVKNSSVTTALHGFFPSSGGTQWNDPYAHGGVGDGDQMAAAKDQASGFGAIDSELFLESKMPSLFDSISEFSEAPVKNKKRLAKAIPLASSKMQLNHQKRGISQQSNREFSTVRQKTTKRSNVEDRLTAALLVVKGKTPLHLALETFDHWDGHNLIASEPENDLALVLQEADVSGRRWLHLSIHHPKAYLKSQTTQVRVMNLKTERVPTPAGAKSLSMTGLHGAFLFNYAVDGSLAMAVEFIPQLTILDIRSTLRERDAELKLATAQPEADQGKIQQLAKHWVQGIPQGWPQVEAVVNRLRREYQHDPDAMVPEQVDDSVEYFLLEAKRGPDYLFATSAALMLRSLGYDTRVRCGFYANPKRYVRTSGLTPVLAEDAHFWVEVLTSEGFRYTTDGKRLPGVWATIEPTPGFQMQYVPETWLQQINRALVSLGQLLYANPLASGFSLIGFVGMVVVRRQILDQVLLVWWFIRSRRSSADRLARLTLRLIEWRAWAHSQKRPSGTTIGRWEALRSEDDFKTLVSWALYGLDAPAPRQAQSAAAICKQAVRIRFQESQQEHQTTEILS